MKESKCTLTSLLLVLTVCATLQGADSGKGVVPDRPRVILLTPEEGFEAKLKSAVEQVNAGNIDVLHFSPGEFRIPGSLEFRRKFTQGGVRITGDGPGVTRLVFSTPTTAIKIHLDTDIRQAAVSPSFCLEELSLLATGKCGTAVEAVRGNMTGKGGTAAKIFRNLTIEGKEGHWQAGIRIQDLTFCSFRDITVRLPPREDTVAISISGNTAPVDHHLSGVRIMGSSTGIHIRGDVEGVYIDQLTMIGVDVGIDWDTDGHEPLLALLGSHISAKTTCIRANRLLQPVIVGNLLYQAGTTHAWTAIDIRTTRPTAYDLLQISNNILHGNPHHTISNTGISVLSASGGVINGNVFSAVDTGIKLGKNASGIEPTNNVFRQTSRRWSESNRAEDVPREHKR